MDPLEQLTKTLLQHKNPTIARWHYQYMKHQFPFLGIQQPLRKKLQKPFLKQFQSASFSTIETILQNLWDKAEREFQYIGLDLALSYQWPQHSIPIFKTMIITKSWWDTVDLLASRLIGNYLKQFPEEHVQIVNWKTETNPWLQRTSLLFQLRYKNQINLNLLFNICESIMRNHNPILQRALAWVLREAGKTFPQQIYQFIARNKNNIVSYVQREALIYIKKS